MEAAKGITPQHLPSSIVGLLETIKSEIVIHYVHPLERDFHNDLRNISRHESDPAECFKKKLAAFQAAQDACQQSLSARLAKEFDLVLSTIPRQLHPSFEQSIAGRQIPTPTTVASSISSNDEETLFVKHDDHDDDEEDDRHHSETMAPERSRILTEYPPLSREHASSRLYADSPSTSSTDSGTSPFDRQRSSKRAREPTASPSSPVPFIPASAPKRAKTGDGNAKEPLDYLVTKRAILTSELMRDECVHAFGQHKGLYVLRCNVAACKVKLQPYSAQRAFSSTEETTGARDIKNATIYFTADPLCNDRAMIHFRARGHGLSNKREMYKKYGVRVLDANDERNLGSSQDRGSCTRLGFVNSIREEEEV